MYEAVDKGLTVHHGDFYEALAYYPDNSFDYVILSQTLQQAQDTVAVLMEALRVGRFLVASFPNFAHWKARLQLLFTGPGSGHPGAAFPVVRHAQHPLAQHQGLSRSSRATRASSSCGTSTCGGAAGCGSGPISAPHTGSSCCRSSTAGADVGCGRMCVRGPIAQLVRAADS